MRQLPLLALALTLAAGCSKKPPPDPLEVSTKPAVTPSNTLDADRARLLNQLRSVNDNTRFDAVEELSVWAETDPATVAALLNLLNDRSTGGTGRTHPARITSMREAAVRALLLAGPTGEAALSEKGFAALRDGLNDPDPAVREHTAYAIGLIGPLARPLSADVQKLCTDTDSHVHGMAFDALRSIGITDVAGFAALLTNENSEIAGLAAELVAGLPDVPESAVGPFTQALKSQREPVRIAAAEGLARAGQKAAPAAAALAEVIKTTYPAEYDPNAVVMVGSELAYWRALGQMGEPAVAPLAALLAHTNAVVRGMAAQTLGELGSRAQPAAGRLKETLKDKFGFVAVEAACALARIGEGTTEAVELVKRAINAPNNVAQTAIEAIPRMGAAGQPLVELALKKLADKENPSARFAAIGLVEGLPPAEAMARAADLGRLTSDEFPEIRRRAAFALERLGPVGSVAATPLVEALATEKDESLRDQFVDALIAMGAGAKTALPSLLPLAADSTLPVNRREKLVAAIVAADPASKSVATTLITISGDSDPSLRAAAASALGQVDPLPSDAIGKLVALAKTDKRTEPRAAALHALAEAGPRAKSARTEIQGIAVGNIQDAQAFLARIAVAAMDGETTKAATIVRAGLTNKKPDLRAAAARALVQVGPKPDDLPALMKLLNDRDAATREAAAKCVGRLGPVAKDAVLRLTKLLSDDTTGEVRIAAASALGDIGPAALGAAPKLQEATRTDLLVKPAARKALEKLGVKERR